MTILFKDISPDVPNLTPFHKSSTAGLTLQIVGHERELYAMSLNAGVWRSLSQSPWIQLQGPPGAYPARAYCIAMDPGNFAHLAVGERDGDAVNPTQDRAGVWESFDSGNTWTCILDPATDGPGGCSSQAIPAITFSSQGLFVATACGLAIRRSGDSTFQWVSKNPLNGQPITLVTALAVSENKVWARIESRNLQNPAQTDYTLLVWSPFNPIESISIPAHASFDGARGDRFSLAALDSNAYISVLGDPTPDGLNNFNTVLIYDATRGLWLTQRILDSRNGTGPGGRRFVKMFILGNQNLPLSLGNRLQLFFCGAQDVFRARGFLPSVPGGFSGLIDWEPFAHTDRQGPDSDPNVHSDIWDFHMINDFDTPGPIFWIAGDGGVLELLPPLPWLTRNAGLHTHHIHTLTAVSSDDFSHGLAHPRLAYATSDNDAWFSDTIPFFTLADCCGDANWTDGDTGNPDFVLTARHRENAMFISYRNTPPTKQGIRLVNYQKGKDASGRVIVLDTIGPDGPTTFRFIQSPKGSAPSSHLDAIMMVELPLTFWDGNNNIPLDPNSPLGQSSQSRPVLIRNKQFEANPDINQSKGQGWFIEANDLPAGTKGFYVSGGHDSPVYYVYTGNGVLYKRSSPTAGWQPVLSGLQIDDPQFEPAQFGLAFVDPYNTNRLYVRTASSVKVSLNGGTSFQDETVLTSLLTGAGKFSFLGTFSGINGSNLPILGRANAMGALSHMAFNRDRPGDVVAASPFTGVFYNRGDGTWLDLTASLPQPLGPISSVGVDYTDIYVGTEGRGIFRATTFHSLRLFLKSKGVTSVRPLQPTGSISVRSLMER